MLTPKNGESLIQYHPSQNVWTVEVPFLCQGPINDYIRGVVVDKVLPIQEDRLRCCRSSDVKEMLTASITALKDKRIRFVPKGPMLFYAPRPKEDRKLIFTPR